MNFNPDDPKWTAYVLGEMEESDRAALELELESSGEAREFVEELRFAASMMKEGLAAERVLGLTPEQHTMVRASAGSRHEPRNGFKQWLSMPARPTMWAAGLVAASLLVAVTLTPSLLRSRQAAQVVTSTVNLTLPDIPATAQMVEKRQENAPENAQQKPRPYGGPVISVREAAVQQEGFNSTAKAEKKIPENKLQDLPVSGASVHDMLSLRGQQGQANQQGQQVQQGGAAAAERTRNEGVRSGVLRGVLPGVLKAQEEAAPPPPPPAAAAPPPPPAAMTALGAGGAISNLTADRTDRIAPSLPRDAFNGYDPITDNPFVAVSQEPLATFSSDVDTASYANVRRFLTQNQLPPRDAVRIEELINYFSYEYPQAAGPTPITGNMEVAAAPWNPQHRLVRVGIKAKDVPTGQKPSNLVFLIDVSGSMGTPERLPLLKSGLRMLVDKLTESDKVSIVTYAGASGVALQPTSGDRKNDILRVIEGLQAQGGTNGGAGIQTAYEMAVSNFINGGVNRVILATDGDFNIGITNQNDLVRLIEDKAKSGVFLTVLGFGNNFKDSLLVKLADRGHGNYAFIDGLNEARKVLVEQMGSTLMTVAKDVKIQTEFNPAQVTAYRLIGYENRVLRAQDFNNDQKDAGDMGAGHTVTALFEVVPRGVQINVPGPGGVDPLRYQPQPQPQSQPPARDAQTSREMLNLKIRYKDPDGSESRLLSVALVDRGGSFANASADFRFAAAVAGFGMILRDSPYKGSANLDWVIATAASSRGADKNGYRQEFIGLAQRASQIRGR
jgi:Ca-activated chloride channel family protein